MEIVRISFTVMVKRAVKKMAQEERFDPTTPGGNTEFRTPRWSLARAVKAHSPKLDAFTAWDKVNLVVTKRLGGWGKYDADGEADIQADFVHCFNSIKSPWEDTWGEALYRAENNPIELATDHNSRDYARFISFAANLSVLVGGDVGLSQRKVGAFLGHNTKTIGEWLRWADGDGLLNQTAEHHFNPKERHRATCAEFAVADSLRNKARKIMA
jgi:hypothetical protein